jgi:Protein of unknown function (DUF2975)
MLTALRRRDFLADLDLLVGLIGIGLIGLAIVDLVGLFSRVAVCADVAGVSATTTLSGLRAGAAADSAVSVCAANPTWSQALLGGLVSLPPVLCAAVAAILLWRVVHKSRRGDPFTPLTVHRLRWLAGWLFVAGLAASLLASLGADLLVRTMVDNGHSSYDPPGWAWVFAAVGIAAVSEIVHRGVSMRAELDAVI